MGFWDSAKGGFNNGVGLAERLRQQALAEKQAGMQEQIQGEQLKGLKANNAPGLRLSQLGMPVPTAPKTVDLPSVGVPGSMGTAEIQAPNDAQLPMGESISVWEKLHPAKTAGGGLPAGVRLKPGERYNPQTDTVEPIPGSDLYRGQADKYSKDTAAADAADMKVKLIGDKVNRILDPKHPEYINSQFGGYGALATKYLHPEAMQEVDSLKQNLKSVGLDLLKSGGTGGIGAISEAEWPIMEGQIEALSPKMSHEQAKEAIQNIQATMQDWSKRMRSRYSQEWGNTPFVNPERTSKGAAPVIKSGHTVEADGSITIH